MTVNFLSTVSTNQFLSRYWQKKPLLIRQAFPKFRGLITQNTLFHLASNEEVESRLITHSRSHWELSRGPFMKKDFPRTQQNWTLLVQDLNHFVPEAWKLLQQFAFIPHARIDDVMVSYATIGGGVGPHVDSYDVFLLQGPGKRRWRISSQKNLEMRENLPLKILKNFRPAQDWILEPGDMLYLPPGYAHEGVAITECMTYSIGFRAPSAQELAEAFLAHLQDNLCIKGNYKDPNLKATKNPGKISQQMVDKSAALLQKIKWNKATVADFFGIYSSEPKPHVFFIPPSNPLTRNRFAIAITKYGLQLSAKSRMLYRNNIFYINGERFITNKSGAQSLRILADNRYLEADINFDEAVIDILWDWYCNGFIEILKT